MAQDSDDSSDDDDDSDDDNDNEEEDGDEDDDGIVHLQTNIINLLKLNETIFSVSNLI